VQCQKITQPTPRNVNESSKGAQGGFQKPKCLKESMNFKLNWNFQGEVGG